MGADEVVRGTACRLLQREGSVGVWAGGVGSRAVTGGRRPGMECVVFGEEVVYNGCIMGSGVDIFGGDWREWV